MLALRLTEFLQDGSYVALRGQVVSSQSVERDQQQWLCGTAGGREEEETEGWVVNRQALHSSGWRRQVLTLQDREQKEQKGPHKGHPPTGSHLKVTHLELYIYILNLPIPDQGIHTFLGFLWSFSRDSTTCLSYSNGTKTINKQQHTNINTILYN